MKRTIATLIIPLLMVLAACGQKQNRQTVTTAQKITLAHCKLDNFYKIDEGIYRSEQPSAADFKALETFGIREVLSLRNYNDDRRESRGTAIEAHSLRTQASEINEDDLIEALKIIHHRKGPILIHCWHGSDRTGAVTAAYRIIYQGWTKERAIDEMVNGGFGFHEKYFSQIIDVIKSLNIDRVKKELESTPAS